MCFGQKINCRPACPVCESDPHNRLQFYDFFCHKHGSETLPRSVEEIDSKGCLLLAEEVGSGAPWLGQTIGNIFGVPASSTNIRNIN